MPLYRAQVELAMLSGNPDDKAVNVWHFIADDLTALDLALTQVTTFYAAIDALMSYRVAATGHRLRCYDMADVEPRASVRDQGIGTLSVATKSLPPEVALCCSFQGPQQSGIPQARRRGRLYLGPWGNSTTINDDGTVHPTLLSTVGGAVQNMLDASQAASTWAWAVYSRASGTAIEVTNAWVDNAWDIQRRRGVAATTRTAYT